MPAKVAATSSNGLAGHLRGLRALYAQGQPDDDTDEEEATEADDVMTARRKGNERFQKRLAAEPSPSELA